MPPRKPFRCSEEEKQLLIFLRNFSINPTKLIKMLMDMMRTQSRENMAI